MALRERVLGKYPNCIFCGGTTPASTVDHVPARTIFDLRDRPGGLEFPACEPCNRGARRDEQIAAMISRVYPDAGTDAAAAELDEIMQGILNNYPGLLEEIIPTFRMEKLARQKGGPEVGALKCDGPILHKAMTGFAAKIGFALHFEYTGRPVPADGAAGVRWFSNVQALDGDLPEDLIKLFGAPRTLRQGKKHVEDQFGYSSVGTESGSMTAHFATFRFSFAVCAFVGERKELVRGPPDARHATIYRPGWLKG
jgi:hypothetical protein